MSFKRDGDDLSMLNMLKHNRVSTLLGEHIPEDEAKLLSNGRLTCTVCSYRPIFDTMAVLSKHRKGKRHILELSRYLKRKEELELEAVKRQQHKLEPLIGPVIPGSSIRENGFFERRKTLDFSIPILPPPTLLVSPTTPSPRSSKSHVRRYLKTLHRKRSLDSLVQEKRDNFGYETNIKALEAHTDNKAPQESIEPSKKVVNVDRPPVPAPDEFNLSLSGWIKDKDGKWVKDVNAEFDSDEDLPPVQQ